MVCHRLIAAERVLVLRDGREEEGEDEVGHEDAKVEHLTLANASPKRSCPALSPLLLKDRRVEGREIGGFSHLEILAEAGTLSEGEGGARPGVLIEPPLRVEPSFRDEVFARAWAQKPTFLADFPVRSEASRSDSLTATSPCFFSSTSSSPAAVVESVELMMLGEDRP
jgi:hypothetical protein